MTPPDPPAGLDPAAVLSVAAELPAVARKLAQLIDDAVAQRATLTTELLADWQGASRATFDGGEVAHARRAAELAAALRRLASDVVDAGAVALRQQHAVDAALPAPPGLPASSGEGRALPTRRPAPTVAPTPPRPATTARPSGDPDYDGHRDPGWEPGLVGEDVAI